MNVPGKLHVSQRSARRMVRQLHHHKAEQRQNVMACRNAAESLSAAGLAFAEELKKENSSSSGKQHTSSNNNKDANKDSSSSISNNSNRPPSLCFVEVASERDIKHNLILDGPLSGVAVAVSDALDVQEFSSRSELDTPLIHHINRREFPLVSWLRRQGASFVGKLSCRTPLALNEGCVFGVEKPASIAVSKGACHYAINCSLNGPSSISCCVGHDVVGFKPTSQTFGTFTEQFKLSIPSMTVGITANRVDDLLYLWQLYTSAIDPSAYSTTEEEVEVAEPTTTTATAAAASSKQKGNEKEKDGKQSGTDKVGEKATKADNASSSSPTTASPSSTADKLSGTATADKKDSKDASAAPHIPAKDGVDMKKKVDTPTSNSSSTASTAVPAVKKEEDKSKTDKSKSNTVAEKTSSSGDASTTKTPSSSSPAAAAAASPVTAAVGNKKDSNTNVQKTITTTTTTAATTTANTSTAVAVTPAATSTEIQKVKSKSKAAALVDAYMNAPAEYELEAEMAPKYARPEILDHNPYNYTVKDRRGRIADIDVGWRDYNAESGHADDFGKTPAPGVIQRFLKGGQQYVSPRVELAVGYPEEWIDAYATKVYGSADEFHRRLSDSVFHRSALHKNQKMEIVPLDFDYHLDDVVKACNIISHFELAKAFESLLAGRPLADNASASASATTTTPPAAGGSNTNTTNTSGAAPLSQLRNTGEAAASSAVDARAPAAPNRANTFHAVSGVMEELPPRIVESIEKGQRLSIADYNSALRMRDDVIRVNEEQFQDVDVFVVPLLSEPFASGDLHSLRLTLPFHLAGNPMLSAQMDKDLPVVLVGEHGRDAALLEDAFCFLQFVRGASPKWWRQKVFGE